MKLILDGNINAYYIQTLCMIFFPGAKFGAAEQENPNAPELYLRLSESIDGVDVYVRVCVDGKVATAEKFYAYTTEFDAAKTAKMACGAAVIAACGEILGYRPSWGMLTGVRPSKVATELLQSGISKTRVKRILASEYFVIPKKAALATDVALNEQKLIGDPSPKDCSVYISIPFCPSRCSYCSFVSYTSPKLLNLIPEYLEHLAKDLEQTIAKIKELGLRICTVYIGGGTPTILSADQLRFLLSKISELIDVSQLEEYTLESGRPDTITAEKMSVAKEYGVTRVCVNPQSLCEAVLQSIGRCHTADDFMRAYEVARASGIPNINTDLIVGLPGDTFKTFSATFDCILSLHPENITVHTFCIKKAAEILRQGNGIYSLRGGDAGKCVDYSQLKTQQEGYLPYYMYRQKNTVGNFENVGFSVEGAEGRYNVYMMEEVHSIFALGAGAVSKMVDYRPKNGGKPVIERLFYPKYPYEYLRDESTPEKIAAMENFYLKHGLLEK
ncbi:MAG: coproporphyrinogen dehydrogenase HemZ [Ruminococcaceae bacterium]|nr:coproporphyrinogen dehydrogenase HemZ [Oscillospiraceae bacterium]